MEVCEELRKRKVDVCGLQKVRWKNEGTRFLRVFGRRYKLWWSGNSSGSGGVGVLVKEEICEKMVDVQRKSDRIMVVVLAFGKQVISAYGPQAGRLLEEKHRFYDELAGEYELQNPNEVAFELGDFNGHVGEEIEGFVGVHGGIGIGQRNAEGRMLLEFCDERELCVANTWFKKTDKRKITFKSGNNEFEIDFILVNKENRKFVKDIKVIPCELQHRLLLADVDKRKRNKVIKKESRIKHMVWKLKEREMQEKFERKVEELVDVETTNLRESFRDGVLTTCDELCGKKKVRKNGGNKWWWNEEVRNAIARKK